MQFCGSTFIFIHISLYNIPQSLYTIIVNQYSQYFLLFYKNECYLYKVKKSSVAFINWKLIDLSQVIMTDKWMNIGYENDELKPHIEPKPDLNDQRRLGMFFNV